MENAKKLKDKKYYLLILILMLITLILLPQKAYAALQSNPSTHYNNSYKKNPTAWMSNIRYMEEANNAMGLTEQFNGDLTSTSSNNIDVHMMRSTEYGAIAILAVSGYGNPSQMQASSIKSTTGNVTGVYYTAQNNSASYPEWVAGGLQGYIFGGTNTRYYDAYSANNGAVKKGDAMNLHWQGTPCANWGDSRSPYFERNYLRVLWLLLQLCEHCLLWPWSCCVWCRTLKGGPAPLWFDVGIFKKCYK